MYYIYHFTNSKEILVEIKYCIGIENYNLNPNKITRVFPY